MTPEERELRLALEARSGEPSQQFRARLTASLGEGRPSSALMQAIAMVAVVAITLGTVGVLLLSRNARSVSHQGPASGSRLASPTPSPTAISLPSTAQLIARPGGVVWALVGGSSLYRSWDQGSSWEVRTMPIPNRSRTSISFVNSLQGWLLQTGTPETHCNSEDAEIWHTTDRAETWQRVLFVHGTQPGGIPYAQCKEHIYFLDELHGFVSAWDDNHPPTIYRTINGGQTWKGSTLPDPPDFKTGAGGFTLRVGVFKSFGNTLYVEAWGRQGGEIPDRQYIFRSIDGGATWSWLTKVPSRYIVMVTESRWLQLMVPGQSMETTSSGQQWHPYASDFNTDTPVGGPQIVFADAQVGYAEGRGALQRTVDGGLHWERIATPGTTPPIPTPSPYPTPSPVPLLPVTDPGFTCRLPVDSVLWANPLNGGFVAVPGGSFRPEPAASLAEVQGQRWTFETSTKPVLKGTGGLFFDQAESRWVPAFAEAVSSDGATYAWTDRDISGPSRLHVTKVADGSDRTFAVPRPQDADIPLPTVLPGPLGLTKDSVFVTYGYEGTFGVWRLDLASGSLTKVTGLWGPSYGAGAIWLSVLRGPKPVGMYTTGDTLARLDLASGAVVDWFHRDDVPVLYRGADAAGNPWVTVESFPPSRPFLVEIWRVRGPGQADLILSGQQISRTFTDSHGTWFANKTGVYLYAGGRVQRVSSASVGEVVGPCV